MILLLLVYSGMPAIAFAQQAKSIEIKKASKKIQKGIEKDNADTLAQGYYDLGDSYYQKGELKKSETNYQKAKTQYEKLSDAEGLAKSSRALAKVQEDLHKDKKAFDNYNTAQQNNVKTKDIVSNKLNTNDIERLLKPDSFKFQEKLILANINLGKKNNDSNEVAINYSRMGELNLKQNSFNAAQWAYNNAYLFSKNNPEQALRFNQLITDNYLKQNDFTKAIETKKQILNEAFVKNSTQLKANEITSLAAIYIRKNKTDTAINLLNESYSLSVKNGHTMEARNSIEKLDSIYLSRGEKDKSLSLYKEFFFALPGIIENDSSLTEDRIIAETEERIKKLELEKQLKDDLIRKKNIFNYWLTGSVILLTVFAIAILLILKKLKTKNKKIALQSLRREMNPHFIFNSLNSINQFISNNNELEANQYLSKFSTLMRRVMENSKEDFVLFTNEVELLQNYLELERSRFPDKFDFRIEIDDALYHDEQLYIPGMLIQPHLENAIWHGLRYIDKKGLLRLSFCKNKNAMHIIIEDNGIGIAESKKAKTSHQKKNTSRGISNMLERIKLLNKLYHQNITCDVEDKPAPDNGVIVRIYVPLLKNWQHED